MPVKSTREIKHTYQPEIIVGSIAVLILMGICVASGINNNQETSSLETGAPTDEPKSLLTQSLEEILEPVSTQKPPGSCIPIKIITSKEELLTKVDNNAKSLETT